MDKQEELNKLFNIKKEEFGEKYDDRIFDQYKLYIEMIEGLNERRATANNFFLSISTGLLTALGVLFNIGISFITNSGWILIGSSSGILFCYTWIRTVKSYSQLTAGKWEVINNIEQKLPLTQFTTEWNILGKGKDPSRYKLLTDVEKYVPLIFIGIYAILSVISIASMLLQ